MPIRPIIQKGNPVLRDEAHEVNPQLFNSPELLEIIQDMHDTLAQEKDGVALAAPQIGISLRIFVINPLAYKKENSHNPLVFINPVIIKTSQKKVSVPEGCLSVRWWYGETRRFQRVTVRAIALDGTPFEYAGSGLLAQIFQHEIDHLDGILFDDHAKNIKELSPSEIHQLQSS